MIYQLNIYFGAFIGDTVIYSVKGNFGDSIILPTDELFNGFENSSIKFLSSQIENNGFDTDDFTFGYLTEKQYKDSLEDTDKFTISKWGEFND